MTADAIADVIEELAKGIEEDMVVVVICAVIDDFVLVPAADIAVVVVDDEDVWEMRDWQEEVKEEEDTEGLE